MIVFATLVTEHRGLAGRRIDANKRGGRLMTTATVVTGRLQIFPVTVKARVMAVRHCLEEFVRLRGRVGLRGEWHDEQSVIRLMTDRAVVVIDFRLVVETPEGSSDKARFVLRRTGSAQRRDHALMFVVRELDRELPFVFRLRRLASIIRLAKSEPHIFARRGAHVTDGADCRAGAGESLPREELLPVTTHTRIVIGKVRRVGKIFLRRPRGWQFVTGVARQALVFVRRMQKRRILHGGSARSLLRR